MKDYRGVRIEYHILQSFPVTCLNRDDVGSPKTAIVGGVERGRVSSQCWKRQVRLALRNLDIHIAVRTKMIAKCIAERCKGDCSEEKLAFIEKMAGAVQSKDTLFFISDSELQALAEYADAEKDPKAALGKKDIDKSLAKELPKLMKNAAGKGFRELDGLDIALFGRMAANAVDLNIQAASSFSHAITTHKIASAVDFFTAVDDFIDSRSDETGAGHIGSSEFTSGTYYRYVSLDLGILSETLGEDADIKKAVDAFTKALYVAIPAARQTTFAGYCPWDYADVLVRRGQGVQLSFDNPVKAKGNGYLEPSYQAMRNQIGHNEKLMGSLYGKIDEFIYGEDEDYSIESLCSDLEKAIDNLPRKE